MDRNNIISFSVFRLIRTAEAGELLGALRAGWAGGASGARAVHLAPDEVAVGAVVTGVERGEPLAVPVGGRAAAHLGGLSPHHLNIIPNSSIHTQHGESKLKQRCMHETILSTIIKSN